jgi:hypothetical protein
MAFGNFSLHDLRALEGLLKVVLRWCRIVELHSQEKLSAEVAHADIDLCA